MSVSDAAALDPQDGGPERKWRRRALWGLVILLPAAILEMGYQQTSFYLQNNDLVARDAEPLTDVHFGGSDWRLENMQTMKDTSSLRIPRDSAPVFVDFTVKIGDADLEQAWLGCKIGLVDESGRSWLPSYVRNSRVDDMATCNSTVFSGAKTGDTVKIRETFVIPKDALETVVPTVGLGSERPYYLRFKRS
ncbi:hypothetical protein G6N74_16410 [Mesorhizobium sp. CGMCC 1.15528]|uniref:Uncharacterized protein n=1 Tax=Mesorhizobium zhangyense TaxID=1776730 RepID=A0A7C9RBH3_9HYPH|nr:hypothetical protein [Mesorhizobium zhangyense]NGN42653.1 hypothetical protein [Mesorhizobium zhangyense]